MRMWRMPRVVVLFLKWLLSELSHAIPFGQLGHNTRGASSAYRLILQSEHVGVIRWSLCLRVEKRKSSVLVKQSFITTRQSGTQVGRGCKLHGMYIQRRTGYLVPCRACLLPSVGFSRGTASPGAGLGDPCNTRWPLVGCRWLVGLCPA